jgi:hypothetical protein
LPQKRKRQAAVPAEDQAYEDVEKPRAKKTKPAKAPSDEEKAGDKGARRLGRKAATAIASPLSSGRSKWVKKMMQQLDIPAPKYVPTASERREEVKQLAKGHVEYVAPTLLSNTNTGDIFGKKTKFDWQESRTQMTGSPLQLRSSRSGSTKKTR